MKLCICSNVDENNDIWVVNEILNRRYCSSKSCWKWGRETSFRPRFVFQKALCEVKASGQNLSFNTFCSPWLGLTIKTDREKFQTVHPGICSMLIFLENGFGLLSASTTCLIFRENFVYCILLYCINWPYFIFWLPIVFEMLDNRCIVITFSQFMTSQILKITLSNRFITWPKKSSHKFKYFKNEKSF